MMRAYLNSSRPGCRERRYEDGYKLDAFTCVCHRYAKASGTGMIEANRDAFDGRGFTRSTRRRLVITPSEIQHTAIPRANNAPIPDERSSIRGSDVRSAYRG